MAAAPAVALPSGFSRSEVLEMARAFERGYETAESHYCDQCGCRTAEWDWSPRQRAVIIEALRAYAG